MCEPTTIAAIAALAVGTGLQMKAQSERKEDMRKLNRAETERQEKYYGESKQYLDENQGLYDRGKADADMAAAAAGRQAEYAAADRAAPRANEQLPGSTGGNSVVADAFTRALAGANQQAGEQGAARANLASFSDFIQDTALQAGRNSSNIGMLGSFTQGSSNVLPLELQHAATKERKKATYGNLLTALGSAMLGGAGAGATIGAGAGAGAGASAAGAGLAGGAAGAAGGFSGLY